LESARAIRRHEKAILEANARDMSQSEELTPALTDRLFLDHQRIESMAEGLESITKLPDPLNRTLTEWDRPNGLHIKRVSVPIGLIGIIYESRPNVTADAAGLCIKSGNAVILRGGKESFHSSQAIGKALHEGLRASGLPEECVQLVPTSDRTAVSEMLRLNAYIDLIIPRGGRGLIERVVEESRIPTLQHYEGNCHTYVHTSANQKMAIEVILNAKMRRTGICGATESLVIDQEIAQAFVPLLLDALSEAGCEVRGDRLSQEIDKRIQPAEEEDWKREYLAPILSLKVVPGLGEAIDFVNQYSSHHTDAVIAEDKEAAEAFLSVVDSAIVMHNTSTQFADGGEFGMGAEIGISTGRLHARGPVGANELTTYKYVVEGSGQIR